MTKSEICPECLNKKHHQAKICRSCSDGKKISTSRKGKPCPDCGLPVKDWYSKRCFNCSLKYRVGKNNPNWKGGIQTRDRKDRTSSQYSEWRRAVFERDSYTCFICKDNKGGNLVAHHILTFKKFPEHRFNPNIGVTLCKSCHINIHKQKVSFWVQDRWNQGART